MILFLDPQPFLAMLAEHYALRANAGNDEPGKSLERKIIDEKLFSWLLRSAGQISKGRVLDIGCFDGQLLDIAKSSGWETHRLEFEGSAANAAAVKHSGRISFGTMESYEPKKIVGLEAYFDAVTAPRD